MKTFLSAIEISKLREKNNWITYYVGVTKNKRIVGTTMLLSHKRSFNSYEFYCPRGFLVDYSDTELVKYFVKEIKKYIREKNGYVLRIDPYIINKQRDIDGNIVENGEDNTKVQDNLIDLGFKKVAIGNMQQVGWMFLLDIEKRKEEEIFNNMRSNTRNIIKKAERTGIVLRELGYSELDKFQQILIDTGKRKGFDVRDLSYFQEMYKLFHDKNQIKYIVTELDLDKYINKLKQDKQEKEDKLSKLSDSKHKAGIKKNLEEEINLIDKKILDAKSIIKENNTKTIILSGAMFILIKPEIVYLFGCNYKEYMHFNSQYLIQWKMIKYGIKNGFSKYNFYGIPANINEHPKDYGIYEFKKGFNGYVEELIGEFELPISNKFYLLKLLHGIRNMFKERI